MDIDEFLDKETSKLGNKAQINEKQGSAGAAKQDANIFEHLDIVKNQLKQNDFNSALSEFDFLKSRYTDMTKKQLSENRFIYNELIKTNNEIISRIESSRSDFIKKSEMVKRYLEDGKAKLHAGRLNEAHKAYVQLNEIFKQLPDIFYEEKNELKYMVMGFSSELFPKLQEKGKLLFEQKKKALQNEINMAYQQIKSNSGQLSQGAYKKINDLFLSLPKGHIYEKSLLYNDILKLFRTTSFIGETNEVLKQMNMMSNATSQVNPRGVDSSGEGGGMKNDFPNTSGETSGIPNQAPGNAYNRVGEQSNGNEIFKDGPEKSDYNKNGNLSDVRGDLNSSLGEKKNVREPEKRGIFSKVFGKKDTTSNNDNNAGKNPAESKPKEKKEEERQNT